MSTNNSPSAPDFVFAVCQLGAETACKAELLVTMPEWRVAFSRPGFLTFKLPASRPSRGFDLKSTFVRTWGFCLGGYQQTSSDELIGQLLPRLPSLPFKHLHVWQTDAGVPGTHGFEPGPSTLAEDIGRRVLDWAARQANHPLRELPLNRLTKPNQLVCDIVIVDPNHWWLGYHRSDGISQRWPGGVPPHNRGSEVISRAYFKTDEALRWSALPIRRGDLCAEIGSAPGGSCQRLLELGAKVIAVDPAELHPALSGHPRLTHLRCRGKELPRKQLHGAKWLLCDLNVAPNYTLQMVEDIVRNRHTHVCGLLLTIKLIDWQLAGEIPRYIERVSACGFQYVKARQLAHNRQEFCLFALRNKSLRRFPARRGRRITAAAQKR